MNKLKVQISFGKDADLNVVNSQLEKLKEEDYEFYCCFPTRRIVENKNFDTGIVDTLEGTLGDKLHWVLDKYETFEDAMLNIKEKRKELAKVIDKIYVLDSGVNEGIKEEVYEASCGKVVLV